MCPVCFQIIYGQVIISKLRHIVYQAGEIMDKKEELMKIFAPQLRKMMIYKNHEYMFREDGGLCSDNGQAYVITPEDIRETMALVSNYSLYAYEDEIRQGFITIKGGHRVGIAGKIILENEKIKSIQYISFMNIRLSHQVKGCADPVMPYILTENGLCHTLIISPPCCGKTTILRDIIRQVSGSRCGQSVGVVDERSEIAACYLGIIAVDEIGSQEDLDAIGYVINCGCKLLATVHGNSVEDLMNKPVLSRLVKERIFERYIVLNNHGSIGHVEAVYNEFGTNLFYH